MQKHKTDKLEKQLKKEYLDLGCWGMSFKKYRNFMDKCEKLGYEVWEDFQFLDRVVIGKIGTLYAPKCHGCGVVVFPEDDNCCDRCLELSFEEE